MAEWRAPKYNKPVPVFVCPKCKEKFDYQSHLDYHVKTIHKDEGR